MDRVRTKVTMQDIAAQLHISKNAVSIALNNKKGVSDSLRKQIIETARAMNYGGYTVSEPKGRCILSVVPEYLHNDPYFYSDIFLSIEKEARREGYISIMSSLSRAAEQALTPPPLPPEMDIAGFLVIGIVSDAYVTRLMALGLPIVAVDIAHPNLSVRCVASANLAGGFAATRYLIESGHRRIGFIGPIYSAQSIYERWCGFQQAMERYGLPVIPGVNITGNRHTFKLFDTVEALEQAASARQLAEQTASARQTAEQVDSEQGSFEQVTSARLPLAGMLENPPTAWFCAGDRIAFALINILTRNGINVPGEVSVIGFDDIPLSQLMVPSLTTMRVDRKLMGRLAVKTLLRGDEKNVTHISLGVTLTERDSVSRQQVSR